MKGSLEAEDEEQLASALEQRGQYLIHASTAKKRRQMSWGRVSRKDVIGFTIHLSSVLSGGVPLIEGLRDLEDQTKNRKFRETIAKVREDIHGGASLSKALDAYPQVFSKLYVNLVRAGEATGNVEMVLNELGSFLEWQEDFHANIKRATTYPVMILGAVGFLVTLLLAFAFPRLMGIFKEMHVSLPLITLIMIAVSEFFEANWILLFAGAITVGVGVRFAEKTPAGKLLVDRIKLRLPVIGTLTRKIALSRFAHYLRLLLQAGVGISESLSIVERVVGNRVISQAVHTAREKVLQGGMLHKSLQATGEFSPLVIRMISIGETT
ncbi:MAG: type II secretion system F family protein, partial [Candidatus Latescibacterota bacterium]